MSMEREEKDLDIDGERRNRYLDRMDTLEERLGDVERWLEDDDDTLLENKERRLALYKAFQEVVEVVADVCAMYLSDATHGIGDDSENIQKAAGRLFSEDIGRTLVKANGLRNRVVHDYNGFSDRKALESMRKHIDALQQFEEEVERWIESR